MSAEIELPMPRSIKGKVVMRITVGPPNDSQAFNFSGLVSPEIAAGILEQLVKSLPQIAMQTQGL